MIEAGRDDEEGHEPTLVMGASIVMECIRAIEECLRCELPGTMNRHPHIIIVANILKLHIMTKETQQQIKLQLSNHLLMSVCVQPTLDANTQLGRFH